MFNNQKSIKILFVIIALVVIGSVVLSSLAIKDNVYLTKRYAFKVLDYFKYKIKFIWANKSLAAGLDVENTLSQTKAIPALAYYGVVNKPDGTNIALEDFENQMFTLKNAGYQTITLKDFYKFLQGEKELPAKSFLLTFDQSRKDSYYLVDPILKALNYNAIMFVITNSLDEANSFDLSVQELKQMLHTQRWEIQSYGQQTYSSIEIDDQNSTGRFFGNKLWLESLARLETDDEFKSRISADLINSKNDLQEKLDVQSLALALPISAFGGNSLNYQSAEDVVLDLTQEKFPLVFNQFWPQSKDEFSANYNLSTDQTGQAKRILVSPEWSETQLLNLLQASQSLNIPYQETFENQYHWMAASGSLTYQDHTLFIETPNKNALAYLDGSCAWQDYQYQATLAMLKDNDTLSLIARYQNPGTYLTCQFSSGAVVIKNVKHGQVEILGSIKNSYNHTSQVQLGMRVKDEQIQCFVNSQPVLTTHSSKLPRWGGIGIKLWNPNIAQRLVALNALEVGPVDDSFNLPILSSQGYEVIYSFFDQGDIAKADALLNNIYDIERYQPVHVPYLNWQEDPYQEQYWRFIFYSLQPTRHLLYAWLKTGNNAYREKLLEIIENFIDHGMQGPYSWDYHGAPFRTMVLVNVWHKLDQANALPENLKTKINQALQVHGDFLYDDAHYEGNYNHGTDQAVALYVLARNFPYLDRADKWLAKAEKRLVQGLEEIIDSDGILVENSPFYHFYTLQKYWGLNQYLKQHHLSLNINLDKKLDQMISYASYILQPDLNTPTLGASPATQIKFVDDYQAMAYLNPNFLYVLTQGALGEQPAQKSIHYPHAGQTIMRSGWGQGQNFTNQTQLIFDVGPYRTDHSDLDALSFHLFGKGIPLLPDVGLYTYQEGAYRDYFHGTRAHNTVVVDNQDQGRSRIVNRDKVNRRVVAGDFKQGPGFSYQAAQHSLYEGADHQRAITLLEDRFVVIVDHLLSDQAHSYEQMFHLFPGAKVKQDGLTLKATGKNPEQTLTIYQLITDNISLNLVKGKHNPPRGLCSTQYGQTIDCYEAAYTQQAQNASYYTVIEIGQHADKPLIYFDSQTNQIIISTDQKEYILKLSSLPEKERQVVVTNKYNTHSWDSQQIILDDLQQGQERWLLKHKNSSQAQSITIVDQEEAGSQAKVIQVKAPLNGQSVDLIRRGQVDLSKQNIVFKMKVDNINSVKTLELILSNTFKQQTASIDINADAYKDEYDGEWLTIGFGRGQFRDNLGHWFFNQPNFDWSAINQITFKLSTQPGQPATMYLGELSTLPDPQRGSVIIIFDDGWDSIMDILPLMEKYGFKGNVGVISDSVNGRRYLTVDQLHELQDVYGWDMINHTARHGDAVIDYYEKNQLDKFEKDLVDGLEYLVDNNLNSGANWFIYPHGKTNQEIKDIVGKYYLFARATQDHPETFPFADPLNIKILSIYADRTTPENALNAIKDAVQFKQPLLLMFHKFSDNAQLYTEYSYQDFEQILKYIQQSGIQVQTVSEFDKSHNVPLSQTTIIKGVPGQIKLEVIIKNK